MKLYDLPMRANPRPKIYETVNGQPGWIEYDHPDGAYSYCVAYTIDGTKLGVCHLAMGTPLEPHLDGYRIAWDEEGASE